ncbi:MAG: YihY/virulence factor BrkB family protein [Oscillospiraceae bacterium]
MDAKKQQSRAYVYAKELLDIYITDHVPRSAAEISYYLTLSIFPMLICLHALLSRFIPDLSAGLEQLRGIVPQATIRTLSDYLAYVSTQDSKALITAGIFGTAMTSAASFRAIHSIMADIQGVPRYRGFAALIYSFLYSLVFLAACYFAALVMFTNNIVIGYAQNMFPQLAGLEFWRYLRFPLMLAVFTAIIYGVYRITTPADIHDNIFSGALVAAVIIVLLSILFSWLISMSVNYPLIYGSLASFIILMLWIYFCGQVLIMGNAWNIVQRRHKNDPPADTKGKSR